MESQFSRSPMWLEFSGLPDKLNAEICPGAWAVFKKIVELDCQLNPMSPGTVEVSLEEIARRTGDTIGRVQRILVKLRKKKLIAAFIPDNAEEPGLFEIVTPLKTPVPPGEIRQTEKRHFRGRAFFRYVDVVKDIDPNDPVLQKVVDLYFSCLGLKMNSMVLDQLRMVRERFALGRIQRVFEQARRNDIASLTWVVRELYKEEAQDRAAKNQTSPAT